MCGCKHVLLCGCGSLSVVEFVHWQACVCIFECKHLLLCERGSLSVVKCVQPSMRVHV